MAARELEADERSADDVVVRHHHAPEVEAGAVVGDLRREPVAEPGDDLVGAGGRARDRDHVARFDPIGAGGHELVVATLHPRHADLVAVPLLELVDGLAAPRADQHGDRLELVVAAITGVERSHEPLGRHHRDQHPEHTEGIGERIAHHGEAAVVGWERGLRGRQRRGVGEATGVDAGRLRTRDSEQLADQRRHGHERAQQQRDEPEHRQAGPQEPRELRPGRQPDAVGEQGEPDDPDDRGDHQPLVDRRRGEPGEQRARRPDADPLDAERPDHRPDREHHAEQHDRLLGQEIDHAVEHLAQYDPKSV